MKSRRVCVGCGWGVLVATACSPGESPEVQVPAWASRDSAGVEIVEVQRSEWPEGRAWRVDPTPVLDMGDLEGTESQQFFRVRDVARFSDGRVVVTNAGTSEVRVYSSTGEPLWTAGGEGEGPGEFSALFAARVRHDTVYAHDFMLARVTVFDDEGRFVRTIPLDKSDGRPLEIWVTAYGFSSFRLVWPEQVGEELAYQRRVASYGRFGPNGSFGGSIAELRGQELIALAREVPGGVVGTSSAPIIAHQSQQVVTNGRFVLGETDHFALQIFDVSGTLERIIQVPSREHPMSPDEFRQALDERLERVETPSALKSIENLAQLWPAPEMRPNFGRFVADSEGYVWIAPYRPARDQPTPFTILDPDGAILGEVDLPYGFFPRDIGPDYVLGTWRDEFDVVHVRSYSLRR